MGREPGHASCPAHDTGRVAHLGLSEYCVRSHDCAECDGGYHLCCIRVRTDRDSTSRPSRPDSAGTMAGVPFCWYFPGIPWQPSATDESHGRSQSKKTALEGVR